MIWNLPFYFLLLTSPSLLTCNVSANDILSLGYKYSLLRDKKKGDIETDGVFIPLRYINRLSSAGPVSSSLRVAERAEIATAWRISSQHRLSDEMWRVTIGRHFEGKWQAEVARSPNVNCSIIRPLWNRYQSEPVRDVRGSQRLGRILICVCLPNATDHSLHVNWLRTF